MGKCKSCFNHEGGGVRHRDAEVAENGDGNGLRGKLNTQEIACGQTPDLYPYVEVPVCVLIAGPTGHCDGSRVRKGPEPVAYRKIARKGRQNRRFSDQQFCRPFRALGYAGILTGPFRTRLRSRRPFGP